MKTENNIPEMESKEDILNQAFEDWWKKEFPLRKYIKFDKELAELAFKAGAAWILLSK